MMHFLAIAVILSAAFVAAALTDPDPARDGVLIYIAVVVTFLAAAKIDRRRHR